MALEAYRRSNIVGKNILLNIGGSWESFEVIGVVSSGGNILQNILFKLDIAVNVIWVYDRT